MSHFTTQMKFCIVLYITPKEERGSCHGIQCIKIYILHHLRFFVVVTQTSSFNIPTYWSSRQWKVYLYIRLAYI